jgi:F-type H+-transporting ATPase subunit delta
MSEFRAAYRYALSLIGVAEETGTLDEVGGDVARLGSLLKESREFRLFIKSPVVKPEKKRKILGDLFQGKLSALTLKFVLLLAAKGRERLLPDIVEQFAKLRDERLGILNVTTRTAVAFSPEQEKTLIAQIAAATKKKVRVNYVLDPALKGGFTIQLDDTVWDASVRHQLEVLRERFVSGTH